MLSFSFLQAVVQMEGDNKMVADLNGIKSVTELKGDTIINVRPHRMGLANISHIRIA